MKILVITEGDLGIGEKISKRFLSEGWFVINLSKEPLSQSHVTNYLVDFSKRGWEKPILPPIIHSLQSANQVCLLHQATRTIPSDSSKINSDVFQELSDVNIIAPLTLNHHLIPFLPETSSVLYTGSISSEEHVPSSYLGLLSKHALINMMRRTHTDLIAKGIHTACICPSFTHTKLFSDVFPKEGGSKLHAIKTQDVVDLVWDCAIHPTMDGAIWHASIEPVPTEDEGDQPAF